MSVAPDEKRECCLPGLESRETLRQAQGRLWGTPPELASYSRNGLQQAATDYSRELILRGKGDVAAHAG